MNSTIHLLDVVALTEELPRQGLSRGQVGTVVDELAPDAFLVEFSDDDRKIGFQAPSFNEVEDGFLFMLHDTMY